MNWKKILNKYRKKSTTEQQLHKKEILEAFKKMMRIEEITEDDFGRYMDGLVFFPEMLYILIRYHEHS